MGLIHRTAAVAHNSAFGDVEECIQMGFRMSDEEGPMGGGVKGVDGISGGNDLIVYLMVEVV